MPARRLRPVGEHLPRVGKYVRVSRVMGRKDERFLSPELQEAAIDRTLDARFGVGGYEVVGSWVDLDESGGTMNRPGLNSARELARSGGLDFLGVYALDRWSRDTESGLAAMRAIQSDGCRLLNSGREIDLDEPDDEFGVSIDLAVATRYRRHVARQWRQTIRTLAEKGIHHGQAPFGYTRTQPHVLEPDANAPLVGEVFRRFLAGHSRSEIGRWLGSHTGRVVSAPQVTKMLRCRVYAGQVRLGEEVFPGRHEALVDAVTWERAQRRLEGVIVPSRTIAAVWPLAGLVVCDECDRKAWRRGGSNGKRTVQCRGRMTGQPCSGFGTPQTDDLVVEVLAAISDYVDNLNVSERNPVAASQRRRAKAQAKAIAAEITAAEAELAVLGRRLAQRVMSPAAYRITTAAVEESLTDLRARLAISDADAHAPTPGQSRQAARELLRMWEFMQPEEQNRAMLGIVRQVRVRRERGKSLGERVEVVWR